MNKELFDELKSNIRYGKFSFREFKESLELSSNSISHLPVFQAVCPDAKVRFVPCVQRVDVERLLRNNGLNGFYPSSMHTLFEEKIAENVKYFSEDLD